MGRRGTMPAGSHLRLFSGGCLVVCLCCRAGAESGVPLVTWQQVPKYEELGSCRVCAPALVEGTGSAAGQPLEAAGSAAFIPAAPLLHPVTHIRLALEEAQHLQQQSTGSCAFRVVLHS